MARADLAGSEFVVPTVIAHRVNPVHVGSLPAAGAGVMALRRRMRFNGEGVGWRPGHTPPLREPQKRRAASLRRKAERGYGSPVTEPSTAVP